MEKTKINPISAEITLMSDYDMSKINFDENIKQSKFESRGLWQFVSYENVELIDNLSDLFTIKNNNWIFLVDWLGWTVDKAEKLDKEDLKKEIISQLNFEDLIDENNTDGLIIERNFFLITTRGYSQGDYARVIIPTKALREVWGTDESTPDKELVSQQYIDNLFWDAPIYLEVKIFASQDYTFEKCEMDEIPEYLNYPKEDINFVNKKILEFIGKKFKYVPALQNILDAVKEAFPSEIQYPKNC